jgi:hypothetical protein
VSDLFRLRFLALKLHCAINTDAILAQMTAPLDLMFFNKIERNRDPKFTRSMYLPVSYERLMWQRSRLAEVVE